MFWSPNWNCLNTVGYALSFFCVTPYNGHSFFECLVSRHFLLFSNCFISISFKIVEFSFLLTWFIQSNLHPSKLFRLRRYWFFPFFVWWAVLSCFVPVVRLDVSTYGTWAVCVQYIPRTVLYSTLSKEASSCTLKRGCANPQILLREPPRCQICWPWESQYPILVNIVKWHNKTGWHAWYCMMHISVHGPL